MYYEMMEQPEALRRTFASELDNMANISKLLWKFHFHLLFYKRCIGICI